MYGGVAPDHQGHMIFIKGLPLHGPRSHHLHLVEPQSAAWDCLLFRDYLGQHPEGVERYQALKRELAERLKEDRKGYTAANWS